MLFEQRPTNLIGHFKRSTSPPESRNLFEGINNRPASPLHHGKAAEQVEEHLRRPSWVDEVHLKHILPAAPRCHEKHEVLHFLNEKKQEIQAATGAVARFTVQNCPSVHTKRLHPTLPDLVRERCLDSFIDHILDEAGLGSRTPEADRKVHQHGSSFGPGGFGDKFSQHWEWPLAHPITVRYDEASHRFEAIFDFRPYQANMLEAHVVCTDLFISCGMERHHKDKLTGEDVKDLPLEFSRTYHLPLNVDPQSIEFFVIENAGQLKVTANTIPVLKLYVAWFADYADIKNLKRGFPVEQLKQLRAMRDDRNTTTAQLEQFVTQMLANAKKNMDLH